MGTVKKEDNRNGYKLFLRLKSGFYNVYNSARRNQIILIWLISTIVLWFNREEVLNMEIGIVTNLNMFFIITIGTCLLLFLSSNPVYALKYEKACQRMGLLNHLGETPIFMYKENDSDSSRGFILHFKSDGIPLDKWIDRQLDVENAFNIGIEQIIQGKNKKHIKIFACSGDYVFPKQILYMGDVRSVANDIILLGESSFGETWISLNVNPHLLIGGTTGSGKSLLLKFVLYQAVQKGFSVYLADFKGGVDFKKYWHSRCTMIFDIDNLIQCLETIIEILENRKQLFYEYECANIDTYNREQGANLERIIFACDEVAELLDKNGLSKEQKEKVTKVEGYLSTIARVGRAFGVHLVLCMQRPDATVLSGQIKNNVDCRICGRAENVLSQIILDNTDASTQISKKSQGEFLTNQGILFKGYWINEDDLQ